MAPTHPAPLDQLKPCFTPISSPRTGALSFYAPAAQRHHARAPSGSTAAHRSEQRRQACSTDTNLLSSALPVSSQLSRNHHQYSFTWTIRDLHLLREEVEHSPPPSEGGRSVSAAQERATLESHPVFGETSGSSSLCVPHVRSRTRHPTLLPGRTMLLTLNEVTAASTSSSIQSRLSRH